MSVFGPAVVVNGGSNNVFHNIETVNCRAVELNGGSGNRFSRIQSRIDIEQISRLVGIPAECSPEQVSSAVAVAASEKDASKASSRIRDILGLTDQGANIALKLISVVQQICR
jgi:hypothetical protein